MHRKTKWKSCSIKNWRSRGCIMHSLLFMQPCSDSAWSQPLQTMSKSNPQKAQNSSEPSAVKRGGCMSTKGLEEVIFIDMTFMGSNNPDTEWKDDSHSPDAWQKRNFSAWPWFQAFHVQWMSRDSVFIKSRLNQVHQWKCDCYAVISGLNVRLISCLIKEKC